MVIRQGGHSGAEANVLCSFRGRGNEHLGTRDDFEAARVVLSDPCLGVSKVIEVLEQLEVAAHCLGRILVEVMKRGEKDPEFHGAVSH